MEMYQRQQNQSTRVAASSKLQSTLVLVKSKRLSYILRGHSIIPQTLVGEWTVDTPQTHCTLESVALHLRPYFLAVPRQLYRFPCHALTHSLPVLKITTKEHSERLVTLETYDQSDEET